MNESKRANILKIAGGNMAVMPVLFGIDKSFRVAEWIFQYCCWRGIVGDSFLRLCEDNKYLPIRVGNYILKKMDGDNFRPLTWNDLT
jgi:hypothetical protein